jgi:hypothetical protein
MKKVSNQPQKLTLSKMTVAKLRLNEQQMYLINGGNGTKPTDDKPPTNGGNQSFVNEPNNQCVTQTYGTGT